MVAASNRSEPNSPFRHHRASQYAQRKRACDALAQFHGSPCLHAHFVLIEHVALPEAIHLRNCVPNEETDTIIDAAPSGFSDSDSRVVPEYESCIGSSGTGGSVGNGHRPRGGNASESVAAIRTK